MSNSFPTVFTDHAVPPPFGSPVALRLAMESIRAEAVAAYEHQISRQHRRAQSRLKRMAMLCTIAASLIAGAGAWALATSTREATPMAAMPTDMPSHVSPDVTPVPVDMVVVPTSMPRKSATTHPRRHRRTPHAPAPVAIVAQPADAQRPDVVSVSRYLARNGRGSTAVAHAALMPID